MKAKERKDLHTKNTNELRTLLRDARQALLVLKLDHSLHKLKNTTELKGKRVDIARIQTILAGKMISDAKEAQNG